MHPQQPKYSICWHGSSQRDLRLMRDSSVYIWGSTSQTWRQPEKAEVFPVATAICHSGWVKGRTSLYWGLICETGEGYTVKDFPLLTWNVILYFIGLLKGFRLATLRVAIHWKGTDLQNFYWFKWELMHVTTLGSRGNDDNGLLIFFPISN